MLACTNGTAADKNLAFVKVMIAGVCLALPGQFYGDVRIVRLEPLSASCRLFSVLERILRNPNSLQDAISTVTCDEPAIEIRGARQHNLKNIDVRIPHGKLIVVTGPSGSGKSSLAIGTIFAEGQRQYVETLSTWARQFVSGLPRADVDSIEGLQPTLCIDQNPSSSSPRSTVGTITEIHDYLRLLMARAADIHCHECHSPIQPTSSKRIVESIEKLPDGTRAMVLAPMVRGRRGNQSTVIEEICKAGLLRVRIDGQLTEIDSVGQLDARKQHSVDAVTDRIVVRQGNTSRIAESVELALRLADGACVVAWQSNEGSDLSWKESVYSTRFACPNCDVAYVELDPKNFSFNSPYGACSGCQGLGWFVQFDEELVLGDETLSINNGAIAAWQGLPKSALLKRQGEVRGFFEGKSITVDTPLCRFTPSLREKFLRGEGNWPGLLTLLEKEFATTLADRRLESLEAFRGMIGCTECNSSRLGQQAKSASINGKTIIDICRAPLSDALRFFDCAIFKSDKREIGTPLVAEITRRLRFLCEVGLSYLTLDRPADSLSGGEHQRVRLATSIGSGLANVCYVLDEPTIGLHPSDNRRLIQAIMKLKDDGNTIIVVEHDAEMMRHADWIIDMGPGAGQFGGEILFTGTCDDMLRDKKSVTGPFLDGRQVVATSRNRRVPNDENYLQLSGARGNNLQRIDVRFPLGLLVVVTGVSGSGKSTLIQDTLAPAITRHIGRVAPRPASFESLQVVGKLSDIVPVNQRPIGRSARSNAATYSDVMRELGKLFAATREARALGFAASRFSFNSSGGWCPVCKGHGRQRIEMNFLPNIWSECIECRGQRYNQQTLGIRYRGYSIADVLAMPISDVNELFQNVEKIHSVTDSLVRTGLGYLPLGQPSTTLSGGEAQRIKLATELSKKSAGNTLYLLDEPTTGLHFEDVRRLLTVLHGLVDQGNSVMVIEHHPDLIASADWEIRLGPGAGDLGGHVTWSGPPQSVHGSVSP